jgi:hypothetical protein
VPVGSVPAMLGAQLRVAAAELQGWQLAMGCDSLALTYAMCRAEDAREERAEATAKRYAERREISKVLRSSSSQSPNSLE